MPIIATSAVEFLLRWFQSVKKVFDRLSEVKEAPKTNKSHSSAYRWYVRVPFVQ